MFVVLWTLFLLTACETIVDDGDSGDGGGDRDSEVDSGEDSDTNEDTDTDTDTAVDTDSGDDTGTPTNPPLQDADTGANEVREGSPIGTTVGVTAQAFNPNGPVYSLADDAGGLFAIDASTGVITVAGATDYETATSHNLTVEVAWPDGVTAQHVFTIDVLDNLAPVLTIDAPFNRDYFKSWIVASGEVTDPEGDAVTVRVLASSASGTAQLVGTEWSMTSVGLDGLRH